ncbi:hypothetical protein SXIM_26320 [Streptomyces xiamenensis]|uniref:Uncharacterized protein n=1 Tax=Streptomyces xiamenensis TaxID=408015 RepID=A0A0F7CP44_9ACTN|nr:hypothetical protein SXIM_26320 [Streptomyces xiamenensis]
MHAPHRHPQVRARSRDISLVRSEHTCVLLGHDDPTPYAGITRYQVRRSAQLVQRPLSPVLGAPAIT